MARSDRPSKDKVHKVGFVGGANQNVVGYSKLGYISTRHHTCCLPPVQIGKIGGKVESMGRWLGGC